MSDATHHEPTAPFGLYAGQGREQTLHAPEHGGVGKGIMTAAVIVLLSGCATVTPTAVRVELEHVSHPLIGWPVDHRSEAGLSQVSGILRWDLAGLQIENGLGYNLDAQGFYGPRLTYTGRISKEFRFAGR